MRLLHARTQQLYTFAYPPPVQYAIFSHTWSSPHDDEWSFYDSVGQEHDSIRHEIILRVCNLTQGHSLEFVWIDSVCIDKSSSADISKAINSLPKYFQKAAICFAFLVDLPCGTSVPCKDTWAQCRFWTRAWTLQELILPAKIQFYDSKWHLRGERSSQHLPSLISGITGIDEEILSRQRTLQQTSVARKMSWAALRKSSSPEDVAYSLLGLFDVYIPIVFGEGSRRAFRRLQEEILKHSNDASLFAWTSSEEEEYRGIFANSPREFLAFAQQDVTHLPFDFKGFVVLASKGVLVSGQFLNQQDGLLLDLGSQTDSNDDSKRLGILFRRSNDGTFARIMASEIQTLAATEKTTAMQVMVFRGRVDDADTNSHEIYFAAYKGGGISAASCNSASSVCSFEPPSTPNRRTAAEQGTPSDITPTGSNPDIAQQWHRGEPGWIKVHEPSCEESQAASDESDGECSSMQVSQQTDIGWPRPNSVMSNVTTVTSPSNTESDFTPHDCQQGDSDLEEQQHCPPATRGNWEMDVLNNHDNIKERLSNLLLDHFADSQVAAGRLRKQRIKRSKVTKRTIFGTTIAFHITVQSARRSFDIQVKKMSISFNDLVNIKTACHMKASQRTSIDQFPKLKALIMT
ncbi:het and ankyrin domain protein [Colletotrichum truncatum]|uniref:Het and ankyrin domain protein n=1 Tax=Colletotrichum truncatum TaxID=5467 RepID=A0ACC3YJP0_COLTU|nr:het and ankyrin domain protein [Colletotrichum truncatum]KAF6797353.1 het and ankyrin domain protein [Colletotrichum truncatum]